MKMKNSITELKLSDKKNRRNFLSGLFLGSLSFLTYFLFKKEVISAESVKSVNGLIPDESGNVLINGLEVSSFDYLSLDRSLEGGTNDKDNYNQLLALVTNAKETKKGLYIPNGEYYISKSLTIDGIQNIKIDGDIVLAKGKVLEMAYDSRSTDSLNWQVSKVTGKLRLSGIKNGWIQVYEADELELFADGDDPARDSIAYSQFVLGTINKLTVLSEGRETGWINENNFLGGRLNSIIIDGNYGHNNNTFIRPFLESAEITINNGESNKFVGVRLEDENKIFFSSKTHSNMIIQQWAGIPRSGYESIGATVTDKGTNNVYIHDLLSVKERLNLFTVNNKTKVFNGSSENGAKFHAGLDFLKVEDWKDVYETDLIPVINGSMFRLHSDQANWRPVISVFDEQRNPIQGAEKEYVSMAGFDWHKEGYYGTNSNVAEAMGVVAQPKVKYIQIKIASGKPAAPFRFISLYMMMDKIKEADLAAQVDTSPRPIALSSAPASGFAKTGQLVSKKKGGIWTCTKSLERRVSETALAGAVSISVNDAKSIANGDVVGILLDNGETHWTTVSKLSGSSFSIEPLPSKASAGQRMVFNDWV
ncbi:hypothetical protein [Neobacillus sp. Marseille-QA0830]